MSRTVNSQIFDNPRLASLTNITATSFTRPSESALPDPPSGVRPAGDGKHSPFGASHVALWPVGVGNDDTTGKICVYGWHFNPVGGSSTTQVGQWEWTILFQADYTVGTHTKSAIVNGSAVTFRSADAIAAPDVGTEDVDCVITQGIANTPAMVIVDLKGHPYYSVDTCRGTLGTSSNAFERRM